MSLFGKVLFLLLSNIFASNVWALTISAAGDTMLQSQGSYLPNNYLDEVSTYFNSTDISFLNYEGTICQTKEVSWKCKKGKTCYAFRAEPKVADMLAQSGVTIASVANNHIYDYGEQCANKTVEHLEQVGIRAVGLRPKNNSSDMSSTRTLTVNGLKVGFAAFHFSNGWGRLISILEYERAQALVRQLDKEVDIIIVSFHGGAEGKDALNVPFEMEARGREKRGNLRQFSQSVVDAGADLVLGHGPHVPRGMEIYKNKLIAYSLSNFATPYGFNLRQPMNLGFILQVELDNFTGDLKGGEIIPTIQAKRPSIFLKVDEKRKVIPVLQNLSIEDFSSPLQILDSGELLQTR